MTEVNRKAFRKAALSAIAVIFIVWQLYGGLRLQNDDQWPFTGYPMYADSHRVGDATEIMKLRGITVSGKAVRITSNDFGMSYYGLRQRMKKRISKTEKEPEELKAYVGKLLALYNKTRIDPKERLIRLEIVYEGRVLRRGGFSDPYQKTIFSYHVD